MCINEKYIICNIMNEVFVIPEEFDKKDFSCVDKLTGSAAQILHEIAKGADTFDKLNERICSIYEADGEERIQIENSIKKFVNMCIQKKYVK